MVKEVIEVKEKTYAEQHKLRTQEEPPHRILREVLRHYSEFKAHVAATGEHVIDYGYYIYNDDGSIKDQKMISISFWDLFEGLNDLAPRKKEAVLYNVIMDQKQKEVAEKMGITTVSVGQYVESACLTLAKRYFAEDVDPGEKTIPTASP